MMEISKEVHEEVTRQINGQQCEDAGKHLQVTPDQEVWLQARILTAMRMALSLRHERRVQADEFLYLYGLSGIAEGAAVEIVKLLGLRPAYINLQDYRNIGGGDRR